jgi:kumamolisin
MPKTSQFANQERVPLTGSEKKAFVPQPHKLAAGISAGTDPSTPDSKPSTGKVTVSVIVRPKQPLLFRGGVPLERLTRPAYAKKHGADPASVKLVLAFAHEFGLTVASSPQPGRRTLHLTGSTAAMQKAFGVTLTPHVSPAGTYRVREGSIWIPQELDTHVVAVLGLDNRPQAQPHFRIATPHATNVSYTPPQVARLYGFPTGVSATGQTIGLIELGGGYRPADITAYFKSLGLPAPTLTAVSVDGGKNKPGKPTGADGEVMLDIEVSASVAPGANVAVYFAPNTDQGFIDAVSTAVHDAVNKPGVVSISWGGPESSWTGQASAALDAACQAAAVLGVTITVAAGDNGSTDGATGNNVDFPASSPHVLACGGTTLRGSGTSITSEVVWNEAAIGEGATGGGVSSLFPLPPWQRNANVPSTSSGAGGRGVPDVSGNADPSTGYVVRVDGQTSVIGGTSAVAPLWAGLITLANASAAKRKTTAGFVNPALYATGARKSFRDITQGNNGAFQAGPGWDACTGLGSPAATALLPVLNGATKKKTKGTKAAAT